MSEITNHERFTINDNRQLATLIYKRFAGDAYRATIAWNRCLDAPDYSAEEFMALVQSPATPIRDDDRAIRTGDRCDRCCAPGCYEGVDLLCPDCHAEPVSAPVYLTKEERQALVLAVARASSDPDEYTTDEWETLLAVRSRLLKVQP